MRKTMYTAANSLAQHMCLAEGEAFEDVWEAWVEEYDPPEELVNDLKTMGRQLSEVGREYIMKVPEKDYRRVVARALKPEINQEEMYGSQEQ